MTTVCKRLAARAAGVLMATIQGERRPSRRRSLLRCELMEGRLVPATVLYTGTEDWYGGLISVTSTVTQDAPGFEGELLWQYHLEGHSVPDLDFDGLGAFTIPSQIPVMYALGPTGYMLPDGWVMTSQGGYGNSEVKFEPTTFPTATEHVNSLDFAFVTPDTAPISTNERGFVIYNDGGMAADGECAAPVLGAADIDFTSGPSTGTNPGDIKFSFRWDNIPTAGNCVMVNVVKWTDSSITVESKKIMIDVRSGKADVVVNCGAGNANLRVVVCLTVCADGTPPSAIFPGVAQQKEGWTK